MPSLAGEDLGVLKAVFFAALKSEFVVYQLADAANYVEWLQNCAGPTIEQSFFVMHEVDSLVAIKHIKID